MTNAKTRQLEDDPKLFELMMEELKNSPQVYQPTNYWSKYINETIRLIREEGQIGQNIKKLDNSLVAATERQTSQVISNFERMQNLISAVHSGRLSQKTYASAAPIIPITACR